MSNNQNGAVTEELPLTTKKIPRNILMVLDNMIRVIPDEKGEENFKSDLERQLTKASYIAPENVYTVWQNVQNIITNRFNAHSDKSTLPQWCGLLLDIWVGGGDKHPPTTPSVKGGVGGVRGERSSLQD
jgi:hypothetical protein